MDVLQAHDEGLVSCQDDFIRNAVLEILDTVKDPEMPEISLVELGMVRKLEVENGRVSVELVPTFVGCPALEMMRRNVEKALSGLENVMSAQVKFVFDIPWTSDRISPKGREKLRLGGIAPPPVKAHVKVAPPCPYCGSNETVVENLFGSTACRSRFYCRQCSQPFEGMKHV